MAFVSSACFLSQKHGCVWCADLVDVLGIQNADLTSLCRLPGTGRWDMTPDVTEADEYRTCETEGLLVPEDEDDLQWNWTVDAKLCELNWIYAHINGFPQDMSSTVCKAFFFSWREGYVPAFAGSVEPDLSDPMNIIPAAIAAHNDCGIWAVGRTQPRGMEIDLQSNSGAITTWGGRVLIGPYGPTTTPNGTDPCRLELSCV